MPRLKYREPFSPREVCYCRKNFTANGRKYNKGDVFDWKKLAISSRKAHKLFNAGYLHHTEPVKIEEKPVVEPVVIEKDGVLPDFENMSFRELQTYCRENKIKQGRSKEQMLENIIESL